MQPSPLPGEADLRAPHAACPVCGAGEPGEPVLRLQGGPAHPEVSLLRCARCAACSASRLPTDAFINRLYDPDRYASSLVSDPTLTTRCARNIVSMLAFERSRPLRILDYGGNDGGLSREIRRQLHESGHRADVRSVVVDLFPRDDTSHQEFIGPHELADSKHEFDLLLASAVLEHLPDVGTSLRTLLHRAAPGTFFYARTPYDAPLQRVVPGYRVKWPRHVHDLGPDFWDRFLEVFCIEGDLRISRPSIVETSLRQSAAKTVAAHLSKAPARFEEAWLRPLLGHRARLWPFVGGWEVGIDVARLRSAAAWARDRSGAVRP